jgi:hypothetical protein
MLDTNRNDIADAICCVLESPNVPDSNFEAANLVDTTQRMGTALFEVAEGYRQIGRSGGRKETGRLMIEAVPVGRALTHEAGSNEAVAEVRAEKEWKASSRRYVAAIQDQRRAEQRRFHLSHARRLRAVMGSLIAHHEAEAEKYLPKGSK